MMDDAKLDSALSRRMFIAAAAAGATAAACATAAPEETTASLGSKVEKGPAIAPDGKEIRAGLIGCGGRGSGAAMNFLAAGPNLKLVAMADLFEDRLKGARERIASRAESGMEVTDENCFVGFDAYKRLLETDVDYIINATPPKFRPEYFRAAVEARKHVFLEKPLAVDPVGVRKIRETAERASALNLCVGTGTQYRHMGSYQETYNRVMDGAIGEMRAARAYYLTGQLWYREPKPEWSEMEAMIRDWVNWRWLSGDHIVEQFIHNMDNQLWFLGEKPVNAVGMGARMRRVTGDQYDFFSVDYEMESGLHLEAKCRQIDGCANNVSDFIVGTRGATNCRDTIYDLNGEIVWQYDQNKVTWGRQEKGSVEGVEMDNSPYVQEHIDLITAIREEKPYNHALDTATSTLAAIMGREAAYTGREITWEEMENSDMDLGPKEMKLGDVGWEAVVPVPGTAE